MFDSNHIIVGLEIGTSKVCAVVGEMTAEGALNIVGLGQARSQGVRKGEIVDPRQVEESIRQAIVEAEKMANVEIRSVYLGVTGSHVRGLNNRGVHPVVSADREITDDDVQDVIKNARTINQPVDMSPLHVIRQHFLVDGQDGITDPVGMLGGRLEVDVHVVRGNTNRLQNAIRVVKGMQIEVEEVVFNGLAASLTLLTPEQKELGCLVVDIGAGTTDYVIYVDGVIRHTGVLALGGDHVSNDLSRGLRVSLSRAEQLKLEHGCAFLDESASGQEITVNNSIGFPERSFSLENLHRIMALRIEEIFELVAQDVEDVGLSEYLRAGVFLCGGCTGIPRVAELAEQIFRLPVRVGKTNSISGIKSALDKPEFATAIGLVKFGSLKSPRREPAGSFVGNALRKIFKR
jgi:cell division protein FtsA